MLSNNPILAVLFFCCLLLWQPQNMFAQSGESIEGLKRQATELTRQMKYTEALPILEKLAVAEPDNPANHFYLAYALIAQRNTTKNTELRKALRLRALEAFVKAQKLGIQEPVVDALVQSLSSETSDTFDAKKYSQHPEANKLMREGEAAFSQGKTDDALASYVKALELDPTIYEAALFAGNVFIQRSDFKQATAWYQKAIAINPTRETAYRYSATPFLRQQKYEQARDLYIEAFITEPYSKYSIGGLTQWGQVTNTILAHPEIDIPVNVAGSDTDAKIQLRADVLKGGKSDGSFAWTSYIATRELWRTEKFAQTFPKEKIYRHSLAEEADALRSVITLATKETKANNLNTSLATLKKLNDDGLLEAYVVMALPDDGIAQDHADYLKQHRDKLRRYVLKYVVSEAGQSTNDESAAANNSGHDETIDFEYDKAKDQNVLRLLVTPIKCVPDACIFLSLEASSPGSKPQPMVRSVLALIIMTKNLEPFADATLTALVDGKEIDLGEMTFAGKLTKEDLSGMGYGISLDNESLLKLATARRLEMRLGTIRFALAPNKINAIADFHRRGTSVK